MVARRAHNPKVTGSSPVPATKEEKSSPVATFFVLRHYKALVNTGITRKMDFLLVHQQFIKIIQRF